MFLKSRNKKSSGLVLGALVLNSIMVFSQLYPQVLRITGSVTSSTMPVQNAVVTFENALDANYRFSTLTDSAGYYQLEVTNSAVTPPYRIPTKFDLGQNYPNPFSATTTIPYSLKQDSRVYLTIYDLLGREVRRIEAGVQPMGNYQVLWDGYNNYGQKVATGLYFYRLEAGGESRIRKLIYDGSGLHQSATTTPQSVQMSKIDLAKNLSSPGQNFTVKLDNCDSTFPVIIPKQVENVYLENDTTINFTVSSVPVAIVYPDSLKQYIRGFGAANILNWRPDMTDAEIEKAFGTGDGQIGFSMLRLRLPSEETTASFQTQVATAKKAYDRGVLIFASPWSPPARMKSNNDIIGGYLLESYYQDYADHLNSFIDYMADNGVDLYAVSVQNEPDIQVNYESCDWSPEQMRKFMAENAATIKTRVIAPESYQFRREMSDPILNDSAACANLDIVGGHIYGGGLGSYPLAEQKGKEIWMTEHLTGEKSHSNDWTWAFDVAKEMHSCMDAGFSAYVWWYIVRYYGPISDGEKESSGGGQKGEVTKKGYVMSQYSRFVRPGYHRIKCNSTPQKSVLATAYKDSASSKIVLVVLNISTTSTLQQTFTIPNGKVTSFTPFTTTSTKNCQPAGKISALNNRITVTLEPSSITTFVSD